jgi:NADH:ubiquinone oxidoreductase subunit 4 (subunit M)
MLQRVNLGVMPQRWKEHPFSDTLAVEWVSWVPLLVGILLLGIFPSIIFNATEHGVTALMHFLGA